MEYLATPRPCSPDTGAARLKRTDKDSLRGFLRVTAGWDLAPWIIFYNSKQVNNVIFY